MVFFVVQWDGEDSVRIVREAQLAAIKISHEEWPFKFCLARIPREEAYSV